jgi:hypothetical protein
MALCGIQRKDPVTVRALLFDFVPALLSIF